MHLKSLNSKLLFCVSLLVICSGMLISFMVTQRYSRSLSLAVGAQAEYLTHAIALEAADRVLTNDLVALQKMLDDHLRSNSSLCYLFIVKNDEILAHTFADGIPVDLIAANEPASEKRPGRREIVSTNGEYYLDMAMPIFDGKAGTLRLGFSEEAYRQQVRRLWVEMALLTLGILLLALTVSLLFLRRITGPLTELAQAANKVDRGDMETRVDVRGHDEVATLAASFNRMLSSLQVYTTRLEDQAMELERAHYQTRSFCDIVQEIGSMQTLGDIGAFLLNRFRSVLACSHLVLLIANEVEDSLFLLSDREYRIVNEPDAVHDVLALLRNWEEHERSRMVGRDVLSLEALTTILPSETDHLVIPLVHNKRPFGAVFATCSDACRCSAEAVHLIHLTMSQAGGVLKRAILHEEEIRHLQNRIEASSQFFGIVSKDPKMQTIFRLIEEIAPTDATVLIQGESGTGKELIARAIHQRSLRKDKPFIVIDCSAYPATLLESELFGHEKGAFTGAIRQKSGRFEQAHGGTVFLDEIGEIPSSAQIKLLRILQTQEFERVGGEKTLSVDLRIVSATNKNLLDQVKNGQFREDLYYRLNVIPIHLPALRERRNDIPLLANHFLQQFAASQKKEIKGFSVEAMSLLLDYSWPGNIRELENSIEHATVLARDGRVEPADLPAAVRNSQSVAPRAARSSTMQDQERRLLLETMEQCGWNKKQAALRLGISRSTLYQKLKKHHIAKPQQRSGNRVLPRP